MKDDDIELLKKKLRRYNKQDISFSNHARNQTAVREGSHEEIARHLLNPENLVYSYQEKSGGSTIHCLHFKMSNTRTMRLPVIFDKEGRKNLYIITYIVRHRSWQNMARRK